jgi:hypothetical protein
LGCICLNVIVYLTEEGFFFTSSAFIYLYTLIVAFLARGLPDPEKEMNPFDPRGLVCDRYGHVLVTDYSSNSVHLLDHSGRFLRLLLTEADGMFGPTSVAIDDSGFLWIKLHMN